MSVRASARVARGARLLDAGRLDERRGPDPARTRSRIHAALRRARGSAPRLNHPDPAPPGRADFSRTTAILRRTSPRSAMNSGTSRGMRPKRAPSTKPGNSTHRRPPRRLLEDGRFAFRLLAVVPLRRARAGFAFFGGFGLSFRRGACAPGGGGGSVALLAWPRGTGAGA